MKLSIEKSWKAALQGEFQKKYFSELESFVRREYASKRCYPKSSEIFKAFELCPFENVKVVILGQDPYINPNQAHGLCFSVKEDSKIPPSLKNVFKELAADRGIVNTKGDLTSWAEQGVLLLNSTLTVQEGASNSHEGKGWGTFTTAAVEALNQKRENLAYVLWGAFAIKKAKMVNKNKNLVLSAPHPSPLSAYRGFFGSKPFSKIDEYLEAMNKTPINWEL